MPPISQDSIVVYFDEIKAASQKSMQLWGKEVYGPMLLVDPSTRTVYANEPDSAGLLKQQGAIYTGILPKDVNISNTAMNWSGKRWATIMLPLPKDKQQRVNLLAHESFHRLQPALGFALNSPENNHLDQKEGRIYLRLELAALGKALQASNGKEVKTHLTHALIFRKYRYAIYDKAAGTENSLELNEGIAEFTGAIVTGRTKAEATAYFLNGINKFLQNPTFVRSFAYNTTPIYGYILYQKNNNWQKQITANTDLTSFFIKAFGINIPANVQAAATRVANNYNGSAIVQQEAEREINIQQLIAEYKRKFIQEPHVDIKFVQMNVSFDPRNIMPLEDKGTVYPNARITDVWGILTVENGALMSPNWDKITVTQPTKMDGNKVTGDGWTLELTGGYQVTKDEATGHFKLIKQ
ncbi:hypothetical protein LX64_04095 [Chitinophaga skermanii]|uniref:Uncharacterized protein n=2 Tax=Chitinophaga skermanii TaxID=331697 RepID=A0A327Q7M1_9BACT|nr:hypothetical protein LX64_04095 [Chitinophaga skermanii]